MESTVGAKRNRLRVATHKAGDRLGQYEILRVLGLGGMAEVYLAREASLGREVALKLLPPELARDEQLIGRFEQEIRQIAQLTHPNIVMLYGVGTTEGALYYTMQPLPGGDLASRIRRGALPATEALRILRRMAEAFAFAHERGVVHRDVKPENILFTEHDEPVLTDFGIAKLLASSERMTKTGMTVGTPAYLSPEQARGRSVDARTDLYALGVIFHEMLTGKVPFRGHDTFSTIMMHLTEPVPQLPADLSPYQNLLSGLMAKDPDQRIPSAEALIVALKAIQRPASPAVTPARPKAQAAPAKPPEPPAPPKQEQPAPPAADAAAEPTAAEAAATMVQQSAVPEPSPAWTDNMAAESRTGMTSIWQNARGTVVEERGPVEAAQSNRPGFVLKRIHILGAFIVAAVLIGIVLSI